MKNKRSRTREISAEKNGGEVAILKKVSITEKLGSEQSLEGEEGVIWTTIGPRGGNSQYKGFKARGYLASSSAARRLLHLVQRCSGERKVMKAGAREHGMLVGEPIRSAQ